MTRRSHPCKDEERGGFLSMKGLSRLSSAKAMRQKRIWEVQRTERRARMLLLHD